MMNVSIWAFLTILTGAAAVSPTPSAMTLVEFLDATEGRCWAVAKDGTAVARHDLPGLEGEVEVECLTEPADKRETVI